MKEMEAVLPSDPFLRIHRSTIVNVDHLQEMRPYGSNGEYTAVLTDGTKRKLSRTYRDEVDSFFDGAVSLGSRVADPRPTLLSWRVGKG